MKITNTLSVKMNWDSFTFPILVGTPVSTAGVLANSADAVGIVPRTVKQKPDAGDELYLMTGGSIYLSEIAYTDLSVAAMQELDGIDFYKQNGHVQPKGGSGGGLTPEQEALIQNAQWKTEGAPTPLFSETYVTEANPGGSYTAQLNHTIDADSIIVTFDGVEYLCSMEHYLTELGPATYYGAPKNGTGWDFEDYPFSIWTSPGANPRIITDTAGSHTVSVVASGAVTYTNTFINGVKANIPVAVYRESVSEEDPSVSGEAFVALLWALVDAGLLERSSLS